MGRGEKGCQKTLQTEWENHSPLKTQYTAIHLHETVQIQLILMHECRAIPAALSTLILFGQDTNVLVTNGSTWLAWTDYKTDIWYLSWQEYLCCANSNTISNPFSVPSLTASQANLQIYSTPLIYPLPRTCSPFLEISQEDPGSRHLHILKTPRVVPPDPNCQPIHVFAVPFRLAIKA